ncbi:MAG: glycosyltransferase family 1 protein [Flavobacterium sp.]|nr:MAG: glycosyltransferase family 1 protein [Flavobacterium sp.]
MNVVVVLFHKLFAKFNKYTVAVSRITKFVCENFYSIPISKVIYNVLPYSSHSFITKHTNSIKDENSICYIGRVIREKGVELICSGVEKLRKDQDRKIIFNVMGGGELLNILKIKYNHPDNHFFGYVDDKTKVEVLAKSKVFISLHPAEPFGVTSLEASAMNCICCLSTIGGHIEFVQKEQLVLIKDVEDVNEIAASLKLSLAIAKSTSFNVTNPYFDNPGLYYKKYANSFLELLNESK